MAIKDLIPWNNKGREVGFQRATDVHPFLALHREMNRMFDDVFRGFRCCTVRACLAGSRWARLAADRHRGHRQGGAHHRRAARSR